MTNSIACNHHTDTDLPYSLLKTRKHIYIHLPTCSGELNGEVDKLTRLVHEAAAPSSQKQSQSYGRVNGAHPVIDVTTMPLPFESPLIDAATVRFIATKKVEKKKRRW